MKVSFSVNQRPVELDVAPMTRLLDVLRRDLGLTGTKEGCGEGECGSCTVLVDGDAVNACLIPVVQVEGCALETVEGLSGEGSSLGPLQESMIRCDAAQCGICTPGMLMAGTAWLRELEGGQGEATAPQARESIAGNLCRCTGYEKIIEALMACASRSHPGAEQE